MHYSFHDQALTELRNAGPELRNGGPNHAPMVIEALAMLERYNAIMPWVEGYRPQLADGPAANTVFEGDREAALGDFSRLGAWENLFRKELQSAPWTKVLETWLPLLIPGSMATGTHGIIRCAHASRALTDTITLARLEEMASALAYCAARYRAIGGKPELTGHLSLAAAVRALPRLEENIDRLGPPPRIVKCLNDRSDFIAAVDRLAMPTDIPAALSELAEIGARLYLHNADRYPLVLLHAVTGPAAVQLIVAIGSDELSATAFAYIWQAVAAWSAAFSRNSSDEPCPTTDESWKTIIDLSVESGDAHAVKFTEACQRLERLRPSSAFRAAASDWSHRVIATRDWSPQRLVDAGMRTRLTDG